MPSFDHADATLAAGPPFLAIAEPTLLLLAFALGALGGAVGDADALDAFGAAAIAQLGAGRPSDPGDLLHRAGQHPHPVAQQAAVGGVVNGN